MSIELLVKGSVVALAADAKDNKNFNLLKTIETEKMKDVEDGFGEVVRKGIRHFKGIFLENRFDSDKQYVIPKKPRRAFLYRESVVLPSVELEAKKNYLQLSDDELVMILKYVELSKQTSLF